LRPQRALNRDTANLPQLRRQQHLLASGYPGATNAMHFHLPKPLHGWREFAGEVGVIVLGVLIALTAEQVAESIRERHDVNELRAALRGELADDRARWEDIRAQDHCIEQRLDALERWAASAPPGAKLRNSVYPLMLWNMHSSAWDIAKTSPAATHVPLKERLIYASLYGAIDNWRQFFSEEYANQDALIGLMATADRPENRAQIPFRIAQERIFLRRRRINYAYFFTRFDELGIRPDISQLTVTANPNAACAPLPKAS
jgi:hypothetical protein